MIAGSNQGSMLDTIKKWLGGCHGMNHLEFVRDLRSTEVGMIRKDGIFGLSEQNQLINQKT